MPNPYLTIPISVRRYFGAWEAVGDDQFTWLMQWAYYGIQEVKKDTVRFNLVGVRSLEGLGVLGRLGLKGRLLFVYPNFIL